MKDKNILRNRGNALNECKDDEEVYSVIRLFVMMNAYCVDILNFP